MDNPRPHKYSKLMPEIAADEFEQIVADIKANGLLEPVWLYEGHVLDGWHRYKACKKAGVEPKFREYKGKDPLAFVESMNLMRRHLDKPARSYLRVLIEKERGTKPDPARGYRPDTPTTRERLASELGVGTATVGRARAVVEHAPELGALILKDEDDPGRLPLEAAAEIARLAAREKNPEKRKRIIEHQIRVRTAPPKPTPTAKYVGPKRWEDVPGVPEAIELMKSMLSSAKKIEAVAKMGKFTPEAGRFVAKRLRDLAGDLLKVAANVERMSK